MTREEKLKKKVPLAAQDIVAACDELEDVYAIDSVTLHMSKHAMRSCKGLAEQIISNLDCVQIVNGINTENFGG